MNGNDDEPCQGDHVLILPMISNAHAIPFAYFPDCDYTVYGNIRTFYVTWLNNDIIKINNTDMLCWVAEQCNKGTTFEGKRVELMNDIVFPVNTTNNMTAIGNYPDRPFSGVFDGNGNSIVNLSLNQISSHYQGLFGYTQNAEILNLKIDNASINGRNYCGGLVAYSENTNIHECCVTNGTIIGLNYCGGLVGYQEEGENSSIIDCYNTSEISGNNYVGGLVGLSNNSTVRNSYAASEVSGQGSAVGAILGGANNILMYHCYFNTDLTVQTNAIGENNTGKEGGEGMTSTQMRDPQFVNTLNQGLTTPVWKRDFSLQINRGFPILQWQSGLGVNENHNLPVSLYPIPTNGSLTIEAEKLRHVSIFNAIGQQVYDGQAEGDVFECNMSDHDAGIYLIRLETASGIATKRLVLVK